MTKYWNNIPNNLIIKYLHFDLFMITYRFVKKYLRN